MAGDEPKAIPFFDPIDPNAPEIVAEVEISMARSDDGGLKQPLALPTPSLVLRVPGSEPVLGYTAVIEGNDLVKLVPGSSIRAIVRFVGVPAREVWEGRTFSLWHGRDVGATTVQKVFKN